MDGAENGVLDESGGFDHVAEEPVDAGVEDDGGEEDADVLGGVGVEVGEFVAGDGAGYVACDFSLEGSVRFEIRRHIGLTHRVHRG